MGVYVFHNSIDFEGGPFINKELLCFVEFLQEY